MRLRVAGLDGERPLAGSNGFIYSPPAGVGLTKIAVGPGALRRCFDRLLIEGEAVAPVPVSIPYPD